MRALLLAAALLALPAEGRDLRFARCAPYWPAATNVLLQSQAFGTAPWTISAASLTVSADATAAPDGTLTADKLVETAITNQHRLDQTTTMGAGTATFSVYAKAAERSWLAVRFAGGANGRYLDAGNCAAGNAIGTSTATATPVGDGWCRFTVTAAASGGDTVYLNLVATGNGTLSYLGVAGSGLFVWQGQFQSGAATAPVPTTTVAVSRAAGCYR